eukprot:SAG31_NODE_64_length_28590_cov_17.914464_14_plen_94_part_00
MFRERHYAHALACYQRALELTLCDGKDKSVGTQQQQESPTIKDTAKDQALFTIYSNIAASWLKLGWPVRRTSIAQALPFCIYVSNSMLWSATS